MKRIYSKLCFICVLMSVGISLTGCTVKGKSFFEFFVDENGETHFILLGAHGKSGTGVIEEETKSQELTEESLENWELPEDGLESQVPLEEASDVQMEPYNTGSISGTSLKKGWTSSDHSILKGKGVSVKGDCILFSVDLPNDREITISYDIVLTSGKYKIVYGNENNADNVLRDEEMIQVTEKIMFAQGRNEIAIISENAVFSEINIMVEGIEVSDF